MLLTLQRNKETAACTRGVLLDERARVLSQTIEPPLGWGSGLRGYGDKAKVKGRIPPGWYALDLTYSPKFGKELPILRYVPGFEGVRIHSGSKPEHTRGCVLVTREAQGQIVELLKSLRDGHEKEEAFIRILDVGH